MNYFASISKRATELNELGQEYLSKLPFMSNDKVAQQLVDLAYEIDQQEGENPEWVDNVLDGHIPFYTTPRNGSLYYSIGFAITARDARLRNLLEVAEGRDKELDLPTLAEKEIVNKYCEASA